MHLFAAPSAVAPAPGPTIAWDAEEETSVVPPEYAVQLVERASLDPTRLAAEPPSR